MKNESCAAWAAGCKDRDKSISEGCGCMLLFIGLGFFVMCCAWAYHLVVR